MEQPTQSSPQPQKNFLDEQFEALFNDRDTDEIADFLITKTIEMKDGEIAIIKLLKEKKLVAANGLTKILLDAIIFLMQKTIQIANTNNTSDKQKALSILEKIKPVCDMLFMQGNEKFNQYFYTHITNVVNLKEFADCCQKEKSAIAFLMSLHMANTFNSTNGLTVTTLPDYLIDRPIEQNFSSFIEPIESSSDSEDELPLHSKDSHTTTSSLTSSWHNSWYNPIPELLRDSNNGLIFNSDSEDELPAIENTETIWHLQEKKPRSLSEPVESSSDSEDELFTLSKAWCNPITAVLLRNTKDDLIFSSDSEDELPPLEDEESKNSNTLPIFAPTPVNFFTGAPNGFTEENIRKALPDFDPTPWWPTRKSEEGSPQYQFFLSNSEKADISTTRFFAKDFNNIRATPVSTKKK